MAEEDKGKPVDLKVMMVVLAIAAIMTGLSNLFIETSIFASAMIIVIAIEMGVNALIENIQN